MPKRGVLNATEEVLATKEGRVLHANEGAALNNNELEGGCSMHREGCLRPRVAGGAE